MIVLVFLNWKACGLGVVDEFCITAEKSLCGSWPILHIMAEFDKIGYGLKGVILLYQLDVKVFYSCQNEWHDKWYKELFLGEWVNKGSA